MEFIKYNGIMVYILKESVDKMICIRVDMDVFFIEEENNIFYKLIYFGKMYVCGYDVYIIMLFGVCKVLYLIKDKFNVNVKFLF